MTPIKQTTSVCSQCLNKIPATVFQQDGRVLLEKRCPEHGEERALLASDSRFYYRADAHGGGAKQGGGCCGPGGALANHSCTMIFEITESCNLTCPTCFTASSPALSWFMPLAEFEAKLDRLLAAGKGDADIVQLSGGEPTIHPDLERMVDMCFAKGVAKVYINSNGIRFAKEPELLQRLSRYKENLQVYLQFDGLRSETYRDIRGAKGLLDLKLRALDQGMELGIYMLPVMAVTRGINMDEIGDVIRMVFERHPSINSLMLQPAFYAGRYLNDQIYERVTVGDIVREVEQQTGGMFTAADFGPIPCSDPNCFSMAVGIVAGDKVLPISRYFPRYQDWSREGIAERIATITNKLPQHMLEALAEDEVVDQLLDLITGGAASAAGGGDGGAPSDDDTARFKDYNNFFVVGIKPFMDANSYDQDRADACCTHVIDREGNPVSLCEYNTIRRPRGLL